MTLSQKAILDAGKEELQSGTALTPGMIEPTVRFQALCAQELWKQSVICNEWNLQVSASEQELQVSVERFCLIQAMKTFLVSIGSLSLQLRVFLVLSVFSQMVSSSAGRSST